MLVSRLILLGFLALVIEAGSFLICTFVLKSSILVYDPYDTSGYDAYLNIRDPVLGWPSPAGLGEQGSGFDLKGARISPAFPDLRTQPCVSVYGDSFAWSSEVDAEHAWPNLLARSLRCRVDNFGVGGYGTDQAYLRYRQNVTAGKESAPIVVISLFTEDIRRNVNQLRGFIYPTDHSQFGLKPRFVIVRNGELRLIPMPLFSHAQFDRALREPAAFFPHEFFLPGSKQGLVCLRFPYTRAVIIVLWRLLVILESKLQGLPLYHAFFQPGHPAHAVEVTAAIVAQFRDDILRSGHKPFVLIIPSACEMRYYRRQHLCVYQHLLDALAQREIAVIDFGSEALRRTSDPCSLYSSCRGHLNERGYDLLAKIVQEHLAAKLKEVRQSKTMMMEVKKTVGCGHLTKTSDVWATPAVRADSALQRTGKHMPY